MNVQQALEAGQDDVVTVNQRALIDKILARYPGEFTVFRELLQNADDANAKHVEICFQTPDFEASATDEQPIQDDAKGLGRADRVLPDLATVIVNKWIVRNNGRPFGTDDWNRLKKIAEGNPDEEKIGAYGVGFYSLFSITETPLVSSGDKYMVFYWKDGKDQLHVRTGSDASRSSLEWTSIQMDLREPGPLPSRPMDMARFLCTSLAFTNSISQISLFFNEHRLFTLSKALSPSKSHSLPPILKIRSPRGFMSVKSVQSADVAIQANVLQWVYNTGIQKPLLSSAMAPEAGFFSFFSSWKSAKVIRSSPQPPPPPKVDDSLETRYSSIQVQIYSAEVVIRLPQKEASDVERATKKKAPSHSSYQIVYTGKEAYDASHSENMGLTQEQSSIFDGLRGDLEGKNTSRIFIGHSTAQSTGMGGHHASRFIPTVEREAIDLVNPTVSIWNKELLYIGGFLCRAIYELELAALGEHWSLLKPLDGSPLSPETRGFLVEKFQHILGFCNFHQSTPAPQVSQELQRAFVTSSAIPSLLVLSSAGIKPSSEVRRHDKVFDGFVKGVATISNDTLISAPGLFDALPAPGIRRIGFDDILTELESRPLTPQEAISCLNWRLDCPSSFFPPSQESSLTRQLLESATLFIAPEDESPERLIPLSTMRTYIDPKSGIPTGSPLPDHCLLPFISKGLKIGRVREVFGWRELTMKSWVAHLVHLSATAPHAHLRISQNPEFAELVLNVLSKQWSSVPEPDQSDILNVLKTVNCIPTKLGMKMPDEAYLPNVDMFPDLPIISIDVPAWGNKLRLLEALGVRKHVDLQLIFTREMASGNWSISKLVSYLVSVKDSLTVEEHQKLGQTRVFLGVSSEHSSDGTRRYLARELYEPSDISRSLGLPMLDWQDAKWHSSSKEAKFLFGLGLQEKPGIDVLLSLATDGKSQRDTALSYFIQNFYTTYVNTYDPQNFDTIAFVPSITHEGTQTLSTPTGVFVDSSCSVLGFPVIQAEWKQYSKSHFKLRDGPSSHQILAALRTRLPHAPQEGQAVFEYLASVVNTFSPSQRREIGDSAIVPYMEENQKTISLLKPTECFVGAPDRKVLSKVFRFVDFGDTANKFLQLCGTQKDPSPTQIATKLLENPSHFYDMCGEAEQYIDEIRRLALQIKNMDRSLRRRLASEKCLIGSRSKARSSRGDDSDDEAESVEYNVLRSNELIIVDDMAAYRLFRESSVWAAPQDDIIEAMYKELGVSSLSEAVKEELNVVGEGTKRTHAREVRSLVLERLPLFLHDQRGTPLNVKYEWLKQHDNFQVKPVSSLMIKSTFSLIGSVLTKVRAASAGAKQMKHGPIILFLADNVELDYYELAHSLCRILFRQHRINDSMLFMTVLSTELRALKRRGYNVDRILNQQKAAQENRLEGPKVQSPPRQESTSARSKSNEMAHTPSSLTAATSPSAAASSDAPKALSQLRQKMKEFHVPSLRGSSSQPGSTQLMTQTQIAQKPITPTQNIERNVSLAISACRQEHNSIIQSREQMSLVNEVEGNGAYCDVSHATDLELVDTLAEFKIYAQRDIPNSHELFKLKHEALHRFAEVVRPLVQDIYKIPFRSIAFFYDLDGPTIAFNRGGSIFLNVRYYEAWHDMIVMGGNMKEPRIAWYFILAHEIAHNLIQVHNAEHEFYFSALCERHLMSLCNYL